MFSFGANGQTTPPLIVYPYKRIPKDIAASVPKDWGLAASDSVWMKREIFFEYVGNIFCPFVLSLNIQFPVILFVDGHKTHLDRKLSELCTNLQIILTALYPNATPILQPADVSTFKPLKDGWKKGVMVWRRNHPTVELQKVHFAPILKTVINNTITPDISTKGFRACGLCPWNPDALDYSKCLGKNKSSLVSDIRLTPSFPYGGKNCWTEQNRAF
ncbi:dde superfamily endonuclease [Holotrichia oblita]|uniref:Dde superfamily endonuclease n=1 Tax=Holotrichia oblita TaxID=644536 RepID=A0ACB9TRB8_HOLOL|nr:dde superfamily endonuclease [Holotrichia oblita]